MPVGLAQLPPPVDELLPDNGVRDAVEDQWSNLVPPPNSPADNGEPVTYAVREDFEDGATDWPTFYPHVMGGQWHISTRRSNSPTHSAYYGNEADGTYCSGAGQGFLHSPQFTVPSTAPVLRLHTWADLRGPATPDRVRVSINDFTTSTWTTLYVSDSDNSGSVLSFPLAAQAGHEALLEFWFERYSGCSNAPEGWYVDDVIVADANQAPDVPTNAAVACGSPHGIALSWTAPYWDGGSPITGYQVYRSTDAGATYTTLATSLTTSYTDLPPWTTSSVLYRVSAINANGEGVATAAVSRAPCDSQVPALSGALTTYGWMKTCGSQSQTGWTAQDTYSGLASVEYAVVNQGAGSSYSGTFTSGFTSGQTTPYEAGGTAFCGWNGINVVKLRTTDRAGLVTGWTDAYIVKQDGLAPAVSGAPVTTSWVNFNPTLGGVCFLDPYSGLAAGSARYWVGNSSGAANYQAATLLPSQPTNGQTTSWCPTFQVSAGTLRQGLNYVTLEAKDALNSVTTSNAYVIRYDTQGDPVSGLVAKTGASGSLLAMDVWQNDNTPRFEWNAATGSSPVAGYSYVLDATGAASPDATSDTPNTYHEPGTLADGTHYFRVRAVDSASNAGTPTSAFPLKVDTALPTLPILSSSTHPDSALYYNRSLASFAWSATDALSGIDGYSYDLVSGTPGGNPDTVKDVEETGTTASYSLGTFGTWTMRVRAVDNAGNWGPTTLKVIHIDTVKPTFTDWQPQGMATPTDAIFVRYDDLDFGADAGFPRQTLVDVSAVEFFVDGQDVIAMWSQICPADGTACYLRVTSGGIEYKPLVPWQDGPHSVFVQIQDTVIEANRNDLTYGFLVNSGSAADQDGDRVPDEVEGEICGRSVTELVVSGTAFLGHSCNGFTDYVPPATGGTVYLPQEVNAGPDADDDGFPGVVVVRTLAVEVEPFTLTVVSVGPGPDFVVPVDTDDADPNVPVLSQATVGPVPVGILPGPDADRDGVPATVTFQTVKLVLDRRSANPVSIVAGTPDTRTVDGNDADPNVPVQSIITVGTPIPTGLSFGPDNDGDGVPQWASVRMSIVTIDRRESDPFTFQDASPVTLGLDSDDGNPDVPIPGHRQTVSAPTYVAVMSDADGDGVPSRVRISWTDVTVDRTQPTPVTTGSHTSNVYVDPDDADRNDPVPYDAFDGDADGVPDEAEFAVCLVEDRRTPSDGTCSGDDYTPPNL
jgi:hypothetical protein